MLSLGPILGQLNARVEGATALPSTMSIGIILGTVLFGPVVDRFGYKWLLIIGSLLSLIGLEGLANALEIQLLHGAMFMIGFGGGILNGLTNALVSDIYDDRRRGGRLSILGAFYCVGALLWTLLNYYMPDNYIVPLHCISGVMALFIVYFCLIPSPRPSRRAAFRLPKRWGCSSIRHCSFLLSFCFSRAVSKEPVVALPRSIWKITAGWRLRRLPCRSPGLRWGCCAGACLWD